MADMGNKIVWPCANNKKNIKQISHIFLSEFYLQFKNLFSFGIDRVFFLGELRSNISIKVIYNNLFFHICKLGGNTK